MGVCLMIKDLVQSLRADSSTDSRAGGHSCLLALLSISVSGKAGEAGREERQGGRRKDRRDYSLAWNKSDTTQIQTVLVLLAVMIQREMTRLGCWWMMMMRGTTFIGESVEAGREEERQERQRQGR